MFRGLSPWLAENAGVLSVIGALIIFFSWAVTNTLGQRYSRLKQSVEAADNTFRLYTELHELRASLNSVAMEAVYAREAAERSAREGAEQRRNGPENREKAEILDLRRRYSHTQLAAHQIKELMDFASQTLEYSSSVGTKTDTAAKIRALNDEIYAVYAEVRDLDRAAEIANGTPSPALPPLKIAIVAYVDHVRRQAIPRVASLYKAIVDSSNQRHDEGRNELARSKRNAARASSTALVLYAIGSALVLGGQYLDKVYKKRLEATKASAALSNPAPPTAIR